jgi:putative DNA primase/helicase
MLDFNPPPPTVTDPPEVAFARAMTDHGLNPGGIVAGSLERFDVEKRGDKAGWYIFYQDGVCPAGSFGNWKAGLKKTWSHKVEADMSAAELDIFRRHVAEMTAKREAELKRIHAEAKAAAERIWSASMPAPADHPYLTKKNVPSYGLKIANDGRLIVPLFDIYNDIHSLQYIDKDNKKFLPGGSVNGFFFTIHGNDQVYI